MQDERSDTTSMDALDSSAPLPHALTGSEIPADGNPTCELCAAAAARVYVLDGYRAGVAVHRAFCLDCAQHGDLPDPETDSRPRLSVSGLLVTGGAALVVFALLGDLILPERHSGFGWIQRIGAALGALTMVLFLLLRIDLVALAGAFVLVLAALADVAGPYQSPGIGWKQQTLIHAGMALITVTITVRWWYLHRQQRRAVAVRRAGVRP